MVVNDWFLYIRIVYDGILCRVWLVSDGLCRAYQLVLLVSEVVYLKQLETPPPEPDPRSQQRRGRMLHEAPFE